MGIKYENRNNEVVIVKSHRLRSPKHLHSHIEVVYMLEGKSRGWINDTCYEINAGDIFIVFPDQVHSYETFGPENYLLLIFPKEICQEYNRWYKNRVPKNALIHIHDFETSHAASLLLRLYEIRNSTEEIDAVIRKGYLLAFLGYMMREMEFVEEKNDEISVLQKLMDYCANNYNQDLSLEILEKELHVNRFYISHLFSQKLKIKFNSYINSLRVEQACILLQKMDMSITDILREVGFSTPRTFNRAFSQIMGTTPSQYRNKYYKKD